MNKIMGYRNNPEMTELSEELATGRRWQWGLRVALVSFAIVWLMIIAVSWARADDGDGESVRNSGIRESSNEDDEYSFNWLDPDKKIYVLQNRKYLKGGHAVLSVMGGVGFSNPYRTTYNVDPRFSYYINETWGVELFYTMTSNTPNTTYQALTIAAPTVQPSVREITAQYGGMIHYVPWYAKINVFNSILYFDWYFGAGAGSIMSYVNSQQAPLTGVFLATGHEYHLSQSFIVRIDMTTAIYQAPINGLTGASAWYSNLNFGIGIGLKL